MADLKPIVSIDNKNAIDKFLNLKPQTSNSKRIRWSRVTIPILLLAISTYNSTAQTRKYSNEFLSIGVGARAQAMGGAQVALTSDVYSGYWNPAGLNLIKNDAQAALMHAEYFAGIGKYDYGSFALPIKDNSRVIGLSIIRFGVDDIPNTLFLIEPDGSVNYDNITSFSVADYAFIFSYAQKIKIKEVAIDVGANAKVIYRKVGDFAQAWGFGFDAGAQFTYKNWQFGAFARDITSTFNAWSFSFEEDEKEVLAATDNIIPESSLEITLPRLFLGTGYYKKLGDKFGLLGTTDFEITTDGKRNTLIKTNIISIDPRAGLEGNYKKFIFLRAGVSNFQTATQDFTDKKSVLITPSIGLGLKIGNFYLDYSLSRLNTSLPIYSNFFSLKVHIDKNPTTTEP